MRLIVLDGYCSEVDRVKGASKWGWRYPWRECWGRMVYVSRRTAAGGFTTMFSKRRSLVCLQRLCVSTPGMIGDDEDEKCNSELLISW